MIQAYIATVRQCLQQMGKSTHGLLGLPPRLRGMIRQAHGRRARENPRLEGLHLWADIREKVHSRAGMSGGEWDVAQEMWRSMGAERYQLRMADRRAGPTTSKGMQIPIPPSCGPSLACAHCVGVIGSPTMECRQSNPHATCRRAGECTLLYGRGAGAYKPRYSIEGGAAESAFQVRVSPACTPPRAERGRPEGFL